MAAKKKDAQSSNALAVQEQRDRTRVKVTTIQEIGRLLNNVVKYGALVACAYLGAQAVIAGVGQETILKLLADVNLSEGAALAVSAITGAGWWNERRMRKNHIETEAPRIRELESKIDPGRSSSNLTPRGDTPPEDHK